MMGLAGGAHEDIFFHPDDPSLNPDVRNADALIDWAVAHYGGAVDPSRVYVTGWSNGAMFGLYYSIARGPTTSLSIAGSRWGTPTPGGTFIAGAAVFSGLVPFGALPSGDCGMQVLPQTGAPIHLIHRACDLVPCNEAQQECSLGFRTLPFPPGATSSALNVEATIDELAAMGDRNVDDVILDIWGFRVFGCDPSAGGFNGWGTCNAYGGDAPPTFIPTPPGGIGAAQVYYTWGVTGGCTPFAGVLNHLLYPGYDDASALDFLAR